MHATCSPGINDHASDLIGINYLNSFCDELSVEIIRPIAPAMKYSLCQLLSSPFCKQLIPPPILC